VSGREVEIPSRYEGDLYDIVTPSSFRGDVEWYRRQARECGSPVLELGAGTGRITLTLARDGIAVHALDIEPGMLRRLRRKLDDESPEVRARVTIVEGDMRSFELAERFALVIAPFRALLHNLTEAQHLACFRRVREHLQPGGRFAFNVFHPSLEFMAQHAGPLAGVWRLTGTFDREDGSYVTRSDANRYDTIQRRIHGVNRYDEYGPDGTLRRTSMLRLELSYLYPSDIRRLLQEAGFRAIEIDGGFDGRPLQHDTDELVVVAGVD
jgi:ubiquinone/menaquinone biosynthesis C-methylase UbiE